LVEEALTLGLQRLDLVVEEKLVDKKGGPALSRICAE
jgi:hypothetical protein